MQKWEHSLMQKEGGGRRDRWARREKGGSEKRRETGGSEKRREKGAVSKGERSGQ